MTVRLTPAPRSEVLGAGQIDDAGGVVNDMSECIMHCPRCHHTGPHAPGPGAGPHYARLVCGQCGAFLRWLPKPRLVAHGGHA